LLDEKSDVRQFLAPYVNHPKTTIRTSAIKALGMLGDARAKPIVEAFLDFGDERISRAAQQAVGKLSETTPAVPKELVELRQDMAALKKNSEHLQAEIKEIRSQLEAQE
jgi:HEAT repeat protein